MKQNIPSHYARRLSELLAQLDFNAIEKVAGMLESAQRAENTIFIAGNGGSAATANHFATDLTWRARASSPPYLRAVSLTTNVPLVSALANDAGFENIFVEQLKTHFKAKDILMTISASGNSPNVLRAVELVNRQQGTSIGFVGFDGGELKNLCQICIHVETPVGEYELVEDAHMVICHMLSSYLRRQSR